MSTSVMSESTPFDAAFAQLDGSAPVHDLRQTAFERFAELGLPTIRQERWRHTNLERPASAGYVLAPPAAPAPPPRALEPFRLTETACHELVFVNGRFAPDLSSSPDPGRGVRLAPLADVLRNDVAAVAPHVGVAGRYDDDALAALNGAMLEDGLFLHLPEKAVLDRPVHLLFVTTADAAGGARIMTHPRIVILAGTRSEARVVETYTGFGSAPYFTNAVTTIVTDEDACVDHYKVQRDTDLALHVSALQVHQRGRSAVTSHSFSIGGQLVRNNVDVALDAEGCDSTFNGLFLVHGEQHVDNHLRIDHLKGHCRSWQFYKGVLDDRAHGVFSGRIYVAEDAQKTDAKQTNMNLLLSERSRVDTMPQLEIFADDVKCTHGATIGQLDEDQLFYLRSRGIGEEAARSLLIYAFANQTISEIRVEELRRTLEELLLERLPRGDLLHAPSS